MKNLPKIDFPSWWWWCGWWWWNGGGGGILAFFNSLAQLQFAKMCRQFCKNNIHLLISVVLPSILSRYLLPREVVYNEKHGVIIKLIYHKFFGKFFSII